MTKVFKEYWIKIILGALFTAIGVVTIIISASGNVDDISRTLCIIWGVFFILSGVLDITLEIIKNYHNPFLGKIMSAGVAIGLGVFLCLPQGKDIINTLVVWAIPCIILSVGVALLIKTLTLIVSKSPKNFWILPFILGAILTVAGTIFLIIDKENVLKFDYIVVGVLFAIYGISAIISGARSSFEVKKIASSVKVEQSEEVK